MDRELEQQVRHRAYEIWESEGCPHGRDFEHWHQASLEFAALAVEDAPVNAEAAVKPAAKKQSAAKPATAKTRSKSARASQMALN